MIVSQFLDGLPRTDAPHPRVELAVDEHPFAAADRDLADARMGGISSHSHAPMHSWFSPISSDRGGADRPLEGGGHHLQAPSRSRSIRGSHVVSGSRRQERVGGVVDVGTRAHGFPRPEVGAGRTACRSVWCSGAISTQSISSQLNSFPGRCIGYAEAIGDFGIGEPFSEAEHKGHPQDFG